MHPALLPISLEPLSVLYMSQVTIRANCRQRDDFDSKTSHSRCDSSLLTLSLSGNDLMTIALAARIVLGLIFTVFGIMGLFGLAELPEYGEQATAYLDGLMGSGFFWPFLKISEIVCGLLLLSGRWVPLALTILAPIVLNIVLFHAFLAPDPNMAVAILALGLGIYLAYAYRDSFKGVLDGQAKPTT